MEGRREVPSKYSKCHALGHIMVLNACPLRFKEPLSQTAQVPDSTTSICTAPVLAPTGASADLAICESMPGHTNSSVGKLALPIDAAPLSPSDVPTSPVPSFPGLAALAEFDLSVPAVHLDRTLQTVADREELIVAPSMPELPVQYTAPYNSPQALCVRYVAARD